MILAAREIPLRNNIYWSLVGNIIYAGVQWIAVAILAKLASPESVGQLALGLAITAPIFTLASLQLRAIVAADSKRSYAIEDYMALRLATIGIALLMAILISFGYHGITRIVICVIAIAKSIEWAGDILYGFLQRQDRLDLIARSMIYKGMLFCICAGLLCSINASALSVAIAFGITWFSVLLLYDIPTTAKIVRPGVSGSSTVTKYLSWRVLKPHWKMPNQKDLLRTSFPLGISMLLISFTTNIPRYYLQQFGGEAQLGIFTALAYFGIAGHQLAMAMGAAASPRMARCYADKQYEKLNLILQKLVIGAGILAVAGVIGACIAGDWILNLCYRFEYAQYNRILILTMIAAGIGYIVAILGYAATAKWRFRAQPIALCAMVGTLLLTCHLLVPQYGVTGAVLASIAAQFIGLIAYGLVVFLPDFKCPELFIISDPPGQR